MGSLAKRWFCFRFRLARFISYIYPLVIHCLNTAFPFYSDFRAPHVLLVLCVMTGVTHVSAMTLCASAIRNILGLPTERHSDRN
jgi:hypothetical protein